MYGGGLIRNESESGNKEGTTDGRQSLPNPRRQVFDSDSEGNAPSSRGRPLLEPEWGHGAGYVRAQGGMLLIEYDPNDSLWREMASKAHPD
jgi:hypothetical protein